MSRTAPLVKCYQILNWILLAMAQLISRGAHSRELFAFRIFAIDRIGQCAFSSLIMRLTYKYFCILNENVARKMNSLKTSKRV